MGTYDQLVACLWLPIFTHNTTENIMKMKINYIQCGYAWNLFKTHCYAYLYNIMSTVFQFTSLVY